MNDKLLKLRSVLKTMPLNDNQIDNILGIIDTQNKEIYDTIAPFLEEYYSGTDTKVYLNNKQQSEISYISFSLNEQLKPIYGYASRTFDDMSVGNRIVTGIFKMPIKNPEEQDSYETVVEPSTLEEINTKNQLEENKKNNTEWINNTDNNTNTSYTNDNVFEYQNKLKQLGYNASDSGTYDDQTRAAIKQFQRDNNIQSVSGTLNNDTMAEIDTQLEVQNVPRKKVEQKTNVYAGLTTASGIVYTLQPNEEFYLIQDLGVFSQIRTIDGKDGYVESSKIVEV